jgi:hypothetical protein
MRTCESPNCNYPVFGTDKNTGKGFCKGHQFLRTDKTPKQRKSLKRPPIPFRSNKRVVEEEEYRKVCNEIDEKLKKEGKWRCFFTGKELPNKASHHHLLGRDGSLLMDERWIVPCFDEPHLNYHDLSVEKLEKFSWYAGFLKRLKEKDEGLYQKEIDKTNKI